jgi:hypothetical protein
MDLEPEQPLQDTLFAPPEMVFALSSASGVVSLGPTDHLPAPLLTIQFTSLVYKMLDIRRIRVRIRVGVITRVAVVPDNVRGSHTYVERIRFEETQRSPMYLHSVSASHLIEEDKYMTVPLTSTTPEVCELYVFVPFGAISAQADQGPFRLVAVQYKLSLGAVI